MPASLEINEQVTEVAEGATVFECAEQLGVRLPTSCFKNGKCRECLVEIIDGAEYLTPRTPEEQHLRENFRLSCRAVFQSDAGRVRCRTLRRGAMRIQDKALGLSDVPGPVSHDPCVTRDGEWVLMDGKPLVKACGPLLGAAVDVGTTTVVLRVVDLESGETLDIQSFENPQRFAGTDVMARIQYDAEQGGRLLQRTILAYLGHAIEATSCDPQTIYEVVVAGNTTMRDLLFGIDVESIGQRPIAPRLSTMWRQVRESTPRCPRAQRNCVSLFFPTLGSTAFR